MVYVAIAKDEASEHMIAVSDDLDEAMDERNIPYFFSENYNAYINMKAAGNSLDDSSEQ